jgi:hypothetical protein
MAPLIRWAHYPRSKAPTALTVKVVGAFENVYDKIASSDHTFSINEVLGQVRPRLESLGFEVESGKKKAEKIHVPVLFGENGEIKKSFEADAYHAEAGFVLEVEAGRAVVNNQFLKDLFQACMMHEVRFLGIAVRQLYQGGGLKSRDFERVLAFFDTLYASNRLSLPLDEVVIVGY